VDGDLRRQQPRIFALLHNSLSLISSGVAILNARPALGFYKIFYNPILKMGAARQTESDARCHWSMGETTQGVANRLHIPNGMLTLVTQSKVRLQQLQLN
jgi:hypothetical protein